MNRKLALGMVLGITTLIIIILLIFSPSTRYNKLILNDSEWNNIINNRINNKNIILDNIKFNDYSLLINDKTIYYSVVDTKNKYNPIIDYDTNSDNIKIAFYEDINAEKIANNNNFKVILYDNNYYNIYDLVITNLPILSINYDKSDKSKNIDMNLKLFDNNNKAFHNNVSTEGKIDIIDNNSDKADYNFSLLVDSVGNNRREFNISVLGMNKHSEYILNSLSSDFEMIRNVFSTNLWNIINNNEMYKYVELFINGEYMGLYSLGYNIEYELLMLDRDEFLFYKKNFIDSERNYGDDSKLEGYILYNSSLNIVSKKNEIKKKCPRGENCNLFEAWQVLNNYYEIIFGNDTKKIKDVTNYGNNIDIYLFYLLTQASNNIDDNTFKDTYVIFRHYIDGYKTEYVPWNLNYTFGYGLNENYSYNDNRFLMKYNPVNRLIELNDKDIINDIKNEYHRLRSNRWSNENINKLLDSLENDIYLSGAYIRNNNKWGNSLNSEKLNSFRDYVMKRLLVMDSYISNL